MGKKINAAVLGRLVFAAVACVWATTGLGQTPAGDEIQEPTLVIGSAAPVIDVERWLKGEPFTSWDSRRLYLIDFWSTGCGPCVESMPHLSELQQKYAEQLIVIGINTREGGADETDYSPATLERVEKFVQKMDEKLKFRLGYDGAGKKTSQAWMDPAGKTGIPVSFIVDGQGRIAYIGHPMADSLTATLDTLINGTFDMDQAAAKYRERVKSELEFKRAQRVFVNDGDIDRSVQLMDELVRRNPKWAGTVLVENFQNLMTAGRYPAAFKLGEAIVGEHFSDNATVLMLVADQIGRLPIDEARPGLDLALRAATRAVEVNKENYPVPPATLARIYSLLGNKDEAIRWQKRALELSPAEYKSNFEPALREYEAIKSEKGQE